MRLGASRLGAALQRVTSLSRVSAAADPRGVALLRAARDVPRVLQRVAPVLRAPLRRRGDLLAGTAPRHRAYAHAERDALEAGSVPSRGHRNVLRKLKL